jgi:hypothetical protein
VKKWRRRCIIIITIHFLFLIISTVVDIKLDIPGKPLAYILGIMSLLLVTVLFGGWIMVTRIKTSLLIFTICSMSFGIIIACIEIVTEVRNYVVMQQEKTFQPFE